MNDVIVAKNDTTIVDLSVPTVVYYCYCQQVMSICPAMIPGIAQSSNIQQADLVNQCLEMAISILW
jgi:hypothetical protein